MTELVTAPTGAPLADGDIFLVRKEGVTGVKQITAAEAAEYFGLSDGGPDVPAGWTSPSGKHIYWRIYVQNVQTGSGYPRVAELEFRGEPGGADQTTGGAPFAISSYSGFPPANAFNNNAGDDWLANNAAPGGVGYQFAVPVAVMQIVLQAGSTAGDTPKNFIVQWSDDGATYSNAWAVTEAVGWTTGELRLFTDPLAVYEEGSEGTGLLYRFGGFFVLTPAANEILMMHVATDPFTIAADLAGSQVKVNVNPSAVTVLTLKKNGAAIGTISISAAGVPTLAGAGGAIVAGDLLTLEAPAASNGLANTAFTLKGVS